MTRTAWMTTRGPLEQTRICPACKRPANAVTGVKLHRPPREEETVPRPGSIIVCAYCSACCIEQPAPFGLRLCTQEEFAQLDPEIQHLVRVWTDIRAGKGRSDGTQ